MQLGQISEKVENSYFLFGSGHSKVAKPAHQKALKKSLRMKGQSCLMLRLSHTAMR